MDRGFQVRLSLPIDWVERAAVGASLACLVHCLALPLLFAALPALSKVFALPESFHLWALAFAIPMATLALVQGRSRHGAVYPLVLGFAGLTLMAIGAILLGGTPAETVATVIGSLTLATGHVMNWRLRHACTC